MPPTPQRGNLAPASALAGFTGDPTSVHRAGAGPAWISTGAAPARGLGGRLRGAVRNGEDGEQPVDPRALAVRARDPGLPAHETLEAGLALPAPVLEDRHDFTITDPRAPSMRRRLVRGAGELPDLGCGSPVSGGASCGRLGVRVGEPEPAKGRRAASGLFDGAPEIEVRPPPEREPHARGDPRRPTSDEVSGGESDRLRLHGQ